ncbi:hypothetical protein [Campylobacter pinnipediorum]|nr:hypothetical protein [Campylobacter pinnipediorum]
MAKIIFSVSINKSLKQDQYLIVNTNRQILLFGTLLKFSYRYFYSITKYK